MKNKALNLACDAETCWQLSKTKLHLFSCSARRMWEQQGSRYESPRASTLSVCSLLLNLQPIFHWFFFFPPHFCDKVEKRVSKTSHPQSSNLNAAAVEKARGCRAGGTAVWPGFTERGLAWRGSGCRDPLLRSAWSSSLDSIRWNGLSRRGTKGGFMSS